MAEKRMFTKKITESDAFLDMPPSTQMLYFHLNMSADDDGFVNNPRKIQRMCNASDDDMKLLIAKSFIIVFDSGIIVIKHWRMHNYIQSDRYKPTVYTDEKSMLKLKQNKSYTLSGDELAELPDSKDNDDTLHLENKRRGRSEISGVVKAWNALSDCGIKPVCKLSSGTKRYDNLSARINEYGIDSVISAIENIKKSRFLQGKEQKNQKWKITFDWFVLPNNFIKVMEGQYDDYSAESVDTIAKNQIKEMQKKQCNSVELSEEEINKICEERGI